MAAHASLFRTESRWGLYHHFVDHPERDDANWFCHTRLYKDAHGAMASRKQAVEPYVIPVDVQGVGKANSYAHLRIPQAA
jgi:succinate dehydrogenase/fumarate reductase flavoprotein subunit